MPEFEIGGTTIKRKNAYMPCALNARFDELPPEEQTRLFKAAYWADNITSAEWPVVLGHDDATRPNKSRLKRKGAGWIMALSRIAYLNPELFKAMVEQARAMYAEQVGEDFPWNHMVPPLAGVRHAEPGQETVVMIREGHDPDEPRRPARRVIDPS